MTDQLGVLNIDLVYFMSHRYLSFVFVKLDTQLANNEGLRLPPRIMRSDSVSTEFSVRLTDK